MPADVRSAGTGVNDWYNSLPPIARTHATVCFLITAAVSFGFLDPYKLILQWPFVLYKFEVRAGALW